MNIDCVGTTLHSAKEDFYDKAFYEIYKLKINSNKKVEFYHKKFRKKWLEKLTNDTLT